MPVILVPRRSDGGERDILWNFTRPFWEKLGFDIVEGDHLEGPFNRSAALNSASRLAGDWDVSILLDSDVIVDLDQVKEGIEYAKSSGTVVFPFRTYRALNPKGTELVMSGFTGNWGRFLRATFRDNKSACVIVPREVWDKVGGFDERFVGWGWEDVAFVHATNSAAGNYRRLSGDLWHLHHARSPENDHKSPLYLANRDLCHRYIEAAHDWETMQELLSEEGGPLA